MNARRTLAIAFALAIAALGAVAFGAFYVLDAGRIPVGLALALVAASFCAAAIGYAFWMVPPETATDRVEPAGESVVEVEDVATTGVIGRRPILTRLFYAALGLFGISLLLPIRSLAPRGRADLQRTKWRSGKRLVREDGTFVTAGGLNVGSAVTVFPENAMDDPPSQAVLVRLPAGSDGTVEGYIAFSRVCTHAGCPVALYRATAKQLMCPCHQSVFNVVANGAVVSGPADRALPRLPLRLGDGDTLEADGDFSTPVGPGYWTMTGG